MKNKRTWFIVIGLLMVLVIAGVVVKNTLLKKPAPPAFTEIKPIMGDIRVLVSSSGTVQPQNRVEVKPTVAGRLEKILVKEGDFVKAGQTVALMSSTERAALLDAAQIKGDNSYQYWQNVYKPIALIAPINGEVILQKSESGQSVNPGDVIMALSDHLIVQSQVDETDIGKVKVAQKVEVRLDAYPTIKVPGTITHISYESVVVNNVTVYNVEVTLVKIPPFFRSGMSANTDILVKSRTNVLTLPLNVIQQGQKSQFVYIKGSDGKPQHKRVKTGLANDASIEITDGVTLNNTVLLMTKKYSLANKNKQGNPLMMNRRPSSSGASRGGH